MVSHFLRMLAVAACVLFLVLVGIPLAVHLANWITPTGVADYPWSTTGLLTVAMQRVPFPSSTFACVIAIVLVLVVVLWGVSAASGLLTPNGRASILRLKFIVALRSRPRRQPLTALASEPLGRIGWFGFFGIRWFKDMLEDTRMLIAPSGSGKTMRFVIRLILRAPGPIVATSTKPDVLEHTALVRMRRHPDGEVMAFDPENLVPWMGERRVKWDIVAGCEQPQMAIKRAAAIVAARPIDPGQSSSAGFFTQAVTIVLQCMLHAAAIGGRSMRDVMRWMGDFDDDVPYNILREAPGAQRSWEGLLTKYCRGKADETVSSTDMSASGILNAFSIDEVLDAVCPAEGDRVVDVSRHHRTVDSLYLICKGEDSPAASVFTALVESMYVMASDDVTRNGRCNPPLELELDEAMNVCTIPSLPRVMSTGRDEGIIGTVIAQDFPQVLDRYGEHKATTIVSNATELLIMGGLKDPDYLQKMSTLAGTLDHLGRGFAKQVLAPDRIRTLWAGRAVLFYRNQPPAVITLIPWWRSKQKREYQASLDWAAAERRRYAESQAAHAPMTEGAAA